MSIVDAIGKLGVSKEANTIEEAVEALSATLLNVLKPAVTLAPKAGSATIFDYTVSNLQTDVSVHGCSIVGTLKKQTTGKLVEAWGEGYFLALDFTKIDPNAGEVYRDYTKSEIKVGLRPSVKGGLVGLDPDMDGAFKITDPKNQVFVIKSKNAEQVFFLDGLVFEE